MMKRHPADERTADQSTQSASGLSGGKPERERVRDRDQEDDDLIARNQKERHATPRRYDEDASDDAAMPANDATMKTKI
jgi:hypothetical protein